MNPPHTPTADLLLEHSGFLRGLARSLVRDEQHAEDVASRQRVHLPESKYRPVK